MDLVFECASYSALTCWVSLDLYEGDSALGVASEISKSVCDLMKRKRVVYSRRLALA